MSAYDNDRRVRPHPDDGTFMIFPGGPVELNVAPMRHPGTWAVIPDLFGAFDAAGRRLDVPEGPFDQVVHALIGDPQ